MIEALRKIENAILKIQELEISNIIEDPECGAYSGYSFRIGKRNVKFRKAKVTPKKNGQFVALWKRNNEKQTIPYGVDDNFDFYMIAAEQQHRSGFFLFPQYILGEKQILTTEDREGKRGFRLYTDWDIPQSKQSRQTKNWQTGYFIDVTDIGNVDHGKFNSIIYGAYKYAFNAE